MKTITLPQDVIGVESLLDYLDGLRPSKPGTRLGGVNVYAHSSKYRLAVINLGGDDRRWHFIFQPGGNPITVRFGDRLWMKEFFVNGALDQLITDGTWSYQVLP